MEKTYGSMKEMQVFYSTKIENNSNADEEAEVSFISKEKPTIRNTSDLKIRKVQSCNKKHSGKVKIVISLSIITLLIGGLVILLHLTSTAPMTSFSTTAQHLTSIASMTSSTTAALPTAAPRTAECSPIHYSNHLKANCSNGRNIHSVCIFSCDIGFFVEGPSSIFCESSLKWSAGFPICSNGQTCPNCSTGPSCMESTSWKILDTQISDVPFVKFKVLFAGFEISCRTSLYRDNPFEWLYDCECTDEKTKVMSKCEKYKSPDGSCEHTLAQLLRTMSALKQYPEACDPSDMPTDC